MKDSELVFRSIAQTLVSEYICIYYVDARTNEYVFYSEYDWYRSLHNDCDGKNFYTDVAKVTEKIIYDDDKYIFLDENLREVLLSQVESNSVHLTDYRLVIDGKPVYHRSKLIRGIGRDDGCFILGVQNVDSEVRERQLSEKFAREREESRKKSAAYSQVVNGLVSRYEIVYYVNSRNGEYSRYSSIPRTDETDMIVPGKDFFVESIKLAEMDVHPEDKDRILAAIDKDHIISSLEKTRQYSADYRRVIKGRTVYTRLNIMRSDDNVHFIVGLENISEEVKKEQEQVEALDRANELARRDSLTGVRNTTAYREFLSSVQKSIDNNAGHSPFAIVVCDVNDLKHINDHKGHLAGDEYIRSACRMICGVFAHSPVFRIGGDEFAAVLAGIDYNNRTALVELLKKRSLDNLSRSEGPVIAVGLGVYDILNDHKVSDVFDRADNCMYENKAALKAGKSQIKSEIPEKESVKMPAERKRLLDGLYETISIMSGESYAYICDMRYNYSRWSKALVDSYGLPSEYMYDAGAIWEGHIHPEDIKPYHDSIEDLFSGLTDKHDQQYRARRINGEYSVVTCKGVVLRDENGEPEHFIGTIRDHGKQSDTDSLTGLKNQYGFFEDVQTRLIMNLEMRIGLIGIARFSEINEIYGYNFGNLVLQKFGRYLYDHVGSDGRVYRLDGTKFAVLSTTRPVSYLKERYNSLRSVYREGIDIDGRHIILELNAGVMDVDDFNVDPQTVMACLNLAYVQSKTRRHGDPVGFNRDLNGDNRQKLEKLHAIRASITKGYSGFYLMYQPVVDARTEKAISAEVLLRWKSDEYGVVPPDLFIPLLEQDPLFPDLGEWILTTAVRAAKEVLKTHPEFVINVNLSYTQLEKPGFVDMVTGVLEKVGYPAGNLCLEITERCRLLDIELLKNIVVSLRGYGVQIALDDFGTGFSSIGIVKELPLNIIKIDRNFISTIEKDDKEKALIRAFVDTATTYGAVVCIEGIETPGMRDILREYDVHSFQGYYYAKPLEYDDFMQYITQIDRK